MKCEQNKVLYERGKMSGESTQKSISDTKSSNWQSGLSSQSLKVIIFGALLILTLSLLFSCQDANAANIPAEQAIKSIVGEAEGEPYLGKLAVAEAIRNRGTLQGVYGLKSPRLAKAPQWVWKDAQKAWEESQSSNVVKGATHWENVKAFGVPYWAKSMEKTATIGNQNFYRVRK